MVEARDQQIQIAAAEKLENGHILVLLPNDQGELAEPALARVSSLLGLETNELKGLFAAAQPLPLACAATHEAAIQAGEEINALGLHTVIVADHLLTSEAPPSRI